MLRLLVGVSASWSVVTERRSGPFYGIWATLFTVILHLCFVGEVPWKTCLPMSITNDASNHGYATLAHGTQYVDIHLCKASNSQSLFVVFHPVTVAQRMQLWVNFSQFVTQYDTRISGFEQENRPPPICGE